MTMHGGRDDLAAAAARNGHAIPEGNGAYPPPAVEPGAPKQPIVIDLTAHPLPTAFPSRHGEGGGITFLPSWDD